MFQHVYNDKVIPQNLTRVDNDGPRYYLDTEGNRYQSVTTFVHSVTDNSGIEKWKEAVGAEQAAFTSKLAASKGTRLHLASELFLNNVINPEDCLKSHVEKFDWKIMKPKIQQHINMIYAQEFQMFSKKLGLAGTVDCIAEFDGKLSIIDFKTSSSDKGRDDIHHYFLQCACYAIMFYELTGIRINQLTIFMIVNMSHVQIFNEPSLPWMKKVLELTSK